MLLLESMKLRFNLFITLGIWLFLATLFFGVANISQAEEMAEEAIRAIEQAREAIDKAQEEMEEADQVGVYTQEIDDDLESALLLLALAESAYLEDDYEQAIEYAKEAEAEALKSYEAAKAAIEECKKNNKCLVKPGDLDYFYTLIFGEGGNPPRLNDEQLRGLIELLIKLIQERIAALTT